MQSLAVSLGFKLHVYRQMNDKVSLILREYLRCSQTEKVEPVIHHVLLCGGLLRTNSSKSNA